MIDNIFSALADPSRREIISILYRREQLPVGVIAKQFPHLTRQAVSKHIQQLVDAGIVQKSRRGRNTFCDLNEESFQEIGRWLYQYDRFWTSKLDNLKRHLDDG